MPRGEREWHLYVRLMNWKGKFIFVWLLVQAIISIGDQGPLL